MAQSTSLSAERHASRSRQAEAEAESQTLEALSRLSLPAWLKERMRDGWCGRMSRLSCPSTEGATSLPFSRSSSGGVSSRPPPDGETLESSPALQNASAFRGECWTLDIPEFPHFQRRCRSEGVASSLSDVVIPGPVPQKYCLAVSYAEALIRRAERLEYRLPPALESVLRQSASRLT